MVRLLAVLVLWPALSRVGYGLDWREGVVLVWAGLRGAVGLSLSLFVLLNRVGILPLPLRLSLPISATSVRAQPFTLAQRGASSVHDQLRLFG